MFFFIIVELIRFYNKIQGVCNRLDVFISFRFNGSQPNQEHDQEPCFHFTVTNMVAVESCLMFPSRGTDQMPVSLE